MSNKPPIVNVSAMSSSEKSALLDDEDLPEQPSEITISGNRSGLLWLAEEILRVANSESELHNHLDSEANYPIYKSPENWWLTIEKNGK